MNPDNTELLKQINTPADLRKLQVSELPQVCDEIRHFIINTLAHNPGHFGSSMGAVELTVALHNAIKQVDDSDYESDKVCEVFQKGYLLGDRLIRPAMVAVSV